MMMLMMLMMMMLMTMMMMTMLNRKLVFYNDFSDAFKFHGVLFHPVFVPKMAAIMNVQHVSSQEESLFQFSH